jgi:solute carrier family 26 anion transporter 8
VKIFQCCNSITFVNVYHLKHKLLKEVASLLPPSYPCSEVQEHPSPALSPAFLPSSLGVRPLFCLQLNLVQVPLKEEEIFKLFNERETNIQESLCRCFCDCEELEPPPRVRDISFFPASSPLLRKSTYSFFKKSKSGRDFDI